MLFAAGFGTRMRNLTATQPKPMIPVAGKPLIDHALDQVTAFDVKRIVVNLHYFPEQVQTHLSGRDITFSLEAPNILETGGGLRKALPMLGPDPLFTMNTDMVWRGPNPLKELAATWDPAKMDGLLLCISKDRALGYQGDGNFLIDPAGRASRGPGPVYTGLQILKTDLLHDVPDQAFSLNVIWDLMLNTGRLYAQEYTGQWCDVGTPEGIALAEAMLQDDHV